jgi:acyl carrier protein
MLVKSDIQNLITREIQGLLLDLDSDSAPLSLDDALFELGLNSLMLAQLLIQLETELDVDPFEDEVSITDMRTVRDLVDAYERAVLASIPVG